MGTTFDATTIDDALADLSAGERTWAATPLRERAELLDQIHKRTGRFAADWVRAARAVKDLPEDSPLVGEEWMSGPMTLLQATAALADTLRKLDAGRSPLDGVTLGSAPGGRVSVPILPLDLYDRLLLSGFSGEVWLRPGVDEATARRDAGLAQRDPAQTGGIGAVLGAGNITSIPPLDTLYELFAHNRVVALKLNPITDPLFTVFEMVFAPLIELGVVRILLGGAEEGGYLVRHPLVAHAHMTGSAQTHDAIVWGTGAEGTANKKAGTPLLDKPITSELGGVSPTLVVPGEWSDADLAFQAAHIATQRLHNGGYNCVAAQAVVIAADWPQRDRFLDELRTALELAPQRTPYYPGSDKRVADALAAYPAAERLGQGRVLVEGVPPAESPLLNTEYFSPVLGVVELPGRGGEFLHRAVDFANAELTGTLGANVLAQPAVIRRLGTAFDRALERLRYGAIAVNAWTGLAFLAPRASWGAYPGHTLDDVQSGIGVVHNAFLLDHVERTVVRGPFRPAPRSLLAGEPALSPKPPWFVDNATAAETGRKLTEFYAGRDPLRLPGLFLSAFRG
ncbi:aldehyde dehydrogenase family protein [Nocardia puris]|uniref:Aldehyde dehydrogenase (NAD(P)+) n=1 Tax=Nocardia puris TaxID=208602 RepID=A0A366DNT7_9NOCA|nr:aldehyde dehydrogenase family protein [Nocardia puris]MBF6214218.1 aldehyde dehydrogenase family protein [Nocardia puris]MBF6365292.1 aldehyde dehydrogenase family protein [Nocardia puris]MBF6459694.1 aldehyde dehydrogenase family protein [Nocardia puris]RBO91761.1 aldehyde dehydrogenase (NAD(P)+) [Nocardia puris]